MAWRYLMGERVGHGRRRCRRARVARSAAAAGGGAGGGRCRMRVPGCVRAALQRHLGRIEPGSGA